MPSQIQNNQGKMTKSQHYSNGKTMTKLIVLKKYSKLHFVQYTRQEAYHKHHRHDWNIQIFLVNRLLLYFSHQY